MFRVSKYLVSKLVCMAQREPEKLRERKQKEKDREQKINIVKVAANQMLKRDSLIPNSKQLQEKVADDFKVPVGSKFVRYVMKKEMKLVYHRCRKVPPRANSERCLVLRQQYALSLLPLLEQGKRIINVDETWLNETSF